MGQLFLFFLVRCLCIVEQFHLSTVQTLMECILDGLALIKSSISIIEAVSLLFFSLGTGLLFILQVAQQLFQFGHLLQLLLTTVPALLVLIMQLGDFPFQCLVLCGQIRYFSVQLIDLPLQIQVFLFGLDVLLHIEFLELSMRTVDGGLAWMERIGGDAFGCGRDALFFLIGLAGYVSAWSDWLLPLQFPDSLQKLPIESPHILIRVVISETFNVHSNFFESDAYFLGDVDYQSLPHLHQLSILADRLFLEVLVPLLQYLFENEEGIGESGMGLQEKVEDCVHAGEVFLVFAGSWLRRMFQVVQFLQEGEGRGLLATGVQQHRADVRKYYYCTINNLPSHPSTRIISFRSLSVFLVWKQKTAFTATTLANPTTANITYFTFIEEDRSAEVAPLFSCLLITSKIFDFCLQSQSISLCKFCWSLLSGRCWRLAISNPIIKSILAFSTLLSSLFERQNMQVPACAASLLTSSTTPSAVLDTTSCQELPYERMTSKRQCLWVRETTWKKYFSWRAGLKERY